ncbi:MAG: hypothetical protein JW969_02495 [Spirochaetales bacterium]|nr:hypothetical protein [Spirochaetales bacterium]
MKKLLPLFPLIIVLLILISCPVPSNSPTPSPATAASPTSTATATPTPTPYPCDPWATIHVVFSDTTVYVGDSIQISWHVDDYNDCACCLDGRMYYQSGDKIFGSFENFYVSIPTTIQATQAGTASMYFYFTGESYCNGVFNWMYFSAPPQEITVLEPE